MNGQRWDGSDLVVNFTDAGVVVEFVDAVVDLDESGGVLGVEILGLVARHPHLPDRVNRPMYEEPNIRVSCDPSADALYLRFGTGRSLDQVVRLAAVVLGADDVLVKVVVRME